MIVALVFWVWWHIVTFRLELNHNEKAIRKNGNTKEIIKDKVVFYTDEEVQSIKDLYEFVENHKNK